MSKKSNLAIGAIIVGTAAGFIAGILTAPKSGKDTRSDIKSKASELKGDAESVVKKIAGKADDAVDIIKDKSFLDKIRFWK